ncbi:MAG: SLBB domain-containing protein [bacterium]
MDKNVGVISFLFLCTLVTSGFSQVPKNVYRDSLTTRSNPFDEFINRPALLSPDKSGEQNDSKPLSLFGVDLFSKTIRELTNSAEVFVLPPHYTLGPGDKIGIFLLGKVQENREVMVNVEGKIFVPPVGVVEVKGLGLEEFKKDLSQKLARYYDNFQLDVMILRPKNVMVAVVGEVVRPGKYVLNAMNTVLDALIMAGGPTATGSMRDIQLMRERTLYASLDLYDFLMSGNSDFDVFLEAGDRIYVPLAKDRVSVAGEVRRPAIFELKPGRREKLLDLIEFAGGFTEYAYQDKIEISRLKQDGHRLVEYVNYFDIVAGDSAQNITLRNEDKLQVYSKLEQIHQRRVAIFGEIRKPGFYELQDNMHVSDLVLKAGNLTRQAYVLEGEIAKIDPGKPTRFLKVNLQSMNNGTNFLLEEDDQVFIRQIPEWEVGLTVEIQGEVRFPGKYSIVKDKTYLSEVLKKAGGFTDEAFLQEATLVRPRSRIKFDKEFERLKNMRREEMTDLEYQYFVMRQNTANVNHIVVDFEKLISDYDKSQDILLEDGDTIFVPQKPDEVSITGRIANPGGVTYEPRAGLTYYLTKAGGASWDADLKRTKVIKVTGEVLDDEDVKRFQPGDIIWIPRKSDKKIWPVILQSISVAAQLASIYLIIDTSTRR